MKKSLSLLLAIALVFGMFSNLAFAAEKSAGELLQEAGVVLGNKDGDLLENQTWLRQNVAILLSRLYGEETEAKATKKNHGFADVKNSDGYITWALEKELMFGKSKTTFGFDQAMKAQEFAAVILRVLKIEVDYKDAVAKAVEVGILPAGTENATEITRGETYKGIVAALNTKVDGVMLGTKLGLKGWKEAAVLTATATVVGAKKVEVKFTSEIDTAKANISVKKDAVTVNVANKVYAADKKSVVLEMASALTEGEYTVTVKDVAEEAVTATFTAQNEKVAKVEVIGEIAGLTLDSGNLIDGAKIGYKVENQYGEDITATAEVKWHVSLGVVDDVSNGVVTLKYPYVKDQTINLTAVVQDVNFVKSYTVKIGDRAVARTIEVKSLYHPTGKELKTNSVFSEFVLLLEVKDQYGAKVKAAQFNQEVLVTTNPAFVNVAGGVAVTALDNQGPNNDTLGLALAAPNANNLAGKSAITFIPKFGGTPYTYEITVVEAAKVANITLNKPTGVVAANDKGVTIPFTAVDQYGNAVTSFEALSATDAFGQPIVDLSLGLRWVEDYVTGNAILKYDAPASKGLQIAMAVVRGTGKVGQLTIDVKDARIPKVVAATKDLKMAYAIDATATLANGNIVLHDQYGVKIDMDYTNYKYQVETVDGTFNTVSVNNAVYGVEFVTGSESFALKAEAAGTERFRIKLFDKVANQAVKGSDLEFTVRVVNKNDINEFAVADIPTVYAANTHTENLDIYGLLTDGTKVALPSNIYSVTTSVYGVAVTGTQTLNATAVDFGGADKEIKGFAIVNIDAKGGVRVSKDMTVTNKAPVITAVKFTGLTEGVLLKTAAVTVSDLVNALEVKDQYGKAIAIGTAHVSFTNVVNKAGAAPTYTNGFNTGAASITGLAVGDTFNVTVITSNGIINTVKVIIIPTT